MNSPDATGKYRPDIDGLRAIAILSVILFHAFPSSFPGGFIGVDIFFVISGFLISSIIVSDLNANKFSFLTFYKRRIRRIFPALITVMLSTMIFGYFSLLPDEFRAIGKHVMGGGTFSSNFVLLFEAGYFSINSTLKPLLHLWSLGIEEQFYIFFPFILYVCFRHKFRIPYLILLLACASFLFNLSIFTSEKMWDFYLPFSRVWELMAGAVLSTCMHGNNVQTLFIQADAKFAKNCSRGTTGNNGHGLGLLLTILGFSVLILGFTSITQQDAYPGYKAVLPVLGCLLLIAAGPHSALNKLVLSNRCMVFIGLISYPLYLWHWPLFAFNNIIRGNYDDLGSRLLLLLLAFVLAILTFLFIEKPLRFGKTRFIELKLVTALVFTTVLGLIVFLADGMPDRQAVAECRQFTNELQWVKTTYLRDPVINGSYKPADELSIPWGDHGKAGWYQYMYKDSGSDVTYAIWGNSYGRHAFYGLANIFARENINTLYIGGWTPKNRLVLPDMNTNDISSIYSGKIIDFLCSQPSIRKIFILHRFFPDILDDPEIYAKKLQSVIDKFSSSKKQVYMIQQNPTLPNNIRHYINRPLKDHTRLVVDRKFYDMEYTKLRKLYSRLNNIAIIDTAPLWCPGLQCRIYDDTGQPLYTDRIHLNRTASMMQAEYVKEYLQNERQGN